MQINTDLLQKISSAAARNLDSYLQKALTASAEHGSFGMQMLDQALLANVQAKEIDPDDAYIYATDKRLFSRYVTDTSVLPKLDLAPG